MGIHSCPYCQCGSCQQHKVVVQQPQSSHPDNVMTQERYDAAEHSNRERAAEYNSRRDEMVWEKGQPNYPGTSWEGSQVVSHVTRNPNSNSQTYYVDRTLPSQNIQGFQQTYHRTPSERWERMPNSPLPEELQKQANAQLRGLAEKLAREHGAQNVQVHQAFITPDQLTPELIRQLPPEQQQQIRQYQQQSKSGNNSIPIQPRSQQPKQGFWDRLRGTQPQQQVVQQVNHQVIQPASHPPAQDLREKSIAPFKKFWVAQRQIGEVNDRYRQAVIAANEEIKQKQSEVIAVANQTISTSNDAKAIASAVSARLELATNQPKLLPPGVNTNVRMGQQTKQQQTLHAAEHNNRTVGDTNRGLYLPESGRVAAGSGRNERAAVESWFNRKSDRQPDKTGRR